MLTNDQMAAEMGSVRDQVLAAMADHEHAAHAGRPCWGNRASAVAFLAHCLGLHADTEVWRYTGDLLHKYTVECGTHCHPDLPVILGRADAPAPLEDKPPWEE